MQIVINIDDKQYNDIIEHYNTFPNEWKKWGLQAIKNGIPLPKGHGRIGDLDRLYNVFEKNVVSADAFKEMFDHAPTIIEADRSEE